MPRYRLTLEYDGGPYNGLQAQAGQPSVQASVEAAVKAFSGETIRLHAAGRTDNAGNDADLLAEALRNNLEDGAVAGAQTADGSKNEDLTNRQRRCERNSERQRRKSDEHDAQDWHAADAVRDQSADRPQHAAD